ncbi:MAG: glycosyltransferase family 1 protein [Clostridia bacterium]|nr:glycosyltransferase family 1 protein [Clostridia bacterium]
MEQKPIRVAQIVGKWLGGGVESFIMNYYRNIDREKIQFDFIIDSDSTVVPKEEIEKMGGRIIKIPPYQNLIKYMISLIKIFKENNYKIVHSHLNSLSVFPLFCAYVSNVPVRIAHSHSTTNRKEWKKNIIKMILKPFSKVFATNYFACTAHAAKWLFGKKCFKDGKVRIINNAINIRKFTYDEMVREKIRKELQIENKVVYGHVGRFVKQKNHIFLINVYKEILQQNENSMLLLIGDGPLEEKIRKIVKEYEIDNKVMFLGIKENVNEIMQALDYFIFPSLYEGLGMVAIEAQCSNLPVIVSDKVPKDVFITDNIISIPLSFKKEIWAEIILKRNFQSRNDMKVKIASSGFDITVEKNRLQEIYLELVRK